MDARRDRRGKRHRDDGSSCKQPPRHAPQMCARSPIHVHQTIRMTLTTRLVVREHLPMHVALRKRAQKKCTFSDSHFGLRGANTQTYFSHTSASQHSLLYTRVWVTWSKSCKPIYQTVPGYCASETRKTTTRIHGTQETSPWACMGQQARGQLAQLAVRNTS